MRFLDVTNNVDESISTLDDEVTLPPPKTRKSSVNEEQAAKAELWRALAAKLSSPDSASLSANTNPPKPISNMTGEEKLLERANIFGKTVVDSLMQCEPRDWPMLKKKIMDLFYDYENYRSHSQTANLNFGTPMPPQNMPNQYYNHQNYAFSPATSTDSF